VTAQVGIVVPAWNAGRFLGDTLASIASQTLNDWVCVIVDDGSDDDTSEIAGEFIRSDDRFTLLRQPASGPSAARNRGMDAVRERSEFLTFMDADDVWLPHALETLVERARGDPLAIGAHALGDFIDERGELLRPGEFAAIGRSRLGCKGGWPHSWSVSLPTCFENVVTQSVLFPPGVMVARADAYRAVGGFDDRVRYAEDWDMVIRLARRGHLAFIDDVVLLYRRHASNLGTSAQVPHAAKRVRQKAFFSSENNVVQRRIVRDAWRAAQVIDALERLRLARAAIGRRRWGELLAQLARLPFSVARYVRGRPVTPDPAET
jgi:glycosyltransferase involved in cell wall biosynthesis